MECTRTVHRREELAARQFMQICLDLSQGIGILDCQFIDSPIVKFPPQLIRPFFLHRNKGRRPRRHTFFDDSSFGPIFYLAVQICILEGVQRPCFGADRLQIWQQLDGKFSLCTSIIRVIYAYSTPVPQKHLDYFLFSSRFLIKDFILFQLERFFKNPVSPSARPRIVIWAPYDPECLYLGFLLHCFHLSTRREHLKFSFSPKFETRMVVWSSCLQ